MERILINKLYPSTNPMEFKSKVIDKWTPVSEVRAFKYGIEATSGFAVLSSLNITHSIRKQLKLGHHARLSCYMPVVGFTLVGARLVQFSVDNDIIELSSCPSCTVAKAVVGQLVSGTIYPIIMAQLISFYLADRILTYPVPSLTQAPREVFELGAKLLSKNTKPILSLAAIQVLTAIVVTHMKQNEFYAITRRN